MWGLGGLLMHAGPLADGVGGSRTRVRNRIRWAALPGQTHPGSDLQGSWNFNLNLALPGGGENRSNKEEKIPYLTH